MASQKKNGTNYEIVSQTSVPHTRNGKHHSLIESVLSDLDTLKPGMAMKIPLKELRHSKAKIRSALNRATNKNNISVATASDASFLYVWKTED